MISNVVSPTGFLVSSYSIDDIGFQTTKSEKNNFSNCKNNSLYDSKNGQWCGLKRRDHNSTESC